MYFVLLFLATVCLNRKRSIIILFWICFIWKNKNMNFRFIEKCFKTFLIVLLPNNCDQCRESEMRMSHAYGWWSSNKPGLCCPISVSGGESHNYHLWYKFISKKKLKIRWLNRNSLHGYYNITRYKYLFDDFCLFL